MSPAPARNGHDPGPHFGFIHIDGASMYQQIENDRVVMARVDTTLTAVQTQVNGIDQRLRALEPKVWAIPSAASAIALAALAVAVWGRFGG